MHIAVVDDTHADRQVIREYLDRYLRSAMIRAEVAYFESGRDFFEKTDLTKLDVAFLDIYIGDATGIEIAEKICAVNSKCLIVLCSVSKEFIHTSYDLNALYYLVKPYEYETFEKVMRRVEGHIGSLSHYIAVMVNRKMIQINIDDILYVDKDGNCVQLHLKQDVLKVWSQTFAEVQDALLKYPQYIKCFQCILLNMKRAVQIAGRNFVLDNGEQVPISRDLVGEVQDRYTRYMFCDAFGGK